jgi:hypothetical protein
MVITESIRRARGSEGIKGVLMRLPPSLFGSEDHYKYYRTYVKPKVSMAGRTFTIKRRSYWRRIENVSVLLNVYTSNSYVVIDVVHVRRSRNDYYYSNSERLVHYTYVLGSDNSGKLFVNRVDWNYPIFGARSVLHTDYISVYEVEDKTIMDLLGFDRSTDLAEESVVSEPGRYRIQGEIIMVLNSWRFENVRNLDDYLEYLRRAFDSIVDDYVRYLATDRLATVLTNLGFSIEVVRIQNRETVAVVDTHETRSEGRERAAALAAKLYRYLGGRDFSVASTMEWADFTYSDPYLGDISVTVRVDGARFGDRYGRILVTAVAVKNSRVREDLARDFDDQLRRLRRRSYRFMIGNHLIELEGAISGNLAYVPSVQPLILPLRSLAVTLNSYYVDRESEVRASHPQHGVNTVRFRRPFAVEFTTTGVSARYPGERNRLLLREAVKEYIVKDERADVRCVVLGYPEGKKLCIW